jgi:hypothetical protein
MSHQAGSEGPVEIKDYFHGLFWTPVIERYTQLIAERVAKDHCGCGLWGLQRVGKTHFGEFLQKTLPGMFSDRLIVIRVQFIGHSFTKPEALLKRALVQLDVRAITGRDPEVLRLKLITAIQGRYLPHTKRVVLIWDEIQNVKEELWGEMMIVEEAIRKDGLTPFQLSIGQPELQNTVDLVEREGRLQAIGRMFQTADEFRGLFLQDVAEFLVEIDGPDNEFTRKHFPVRASAGWSIKRLIEPLQEAVDSLANWPGLQRMVCIPASTLRQTLNAMFIFLDEPNNHTKEVDKEVVLRAFTDNGFKRRFMAYSRPLPHGIGGGA